MANTTSKNSHAYDSYSDWIKYWLEDFDRNMESIVHVDKETSKDVEESVG